MYKGIINTDTTVTAGQNVPFKTALNTNSKTYYDSTNNVVDINSTGYYDIYLTMVVTDVTGSSVTANIFGDGEEILGAAAVETISATTDIKTLNIMTVVRVAVAPSTDLAKISVELDTSATIQSASLIVEARK